ATLEIGGIPARTLQLESRYSQLFRKGRRTASRAIDQRGIGNHLENIPGVATGATLVRINRHSFGSACLRLRRGNSQNLRLSAAMPFWLLQAGMRLKRQRALFAPFVCRARPVTRAESPDSA